MSEAHKEWKLVPVEPTIEMKQEAGKYRDMCKSIGLTRTFGGYYRAMIKAAPKAPLFSDLVTKYTNKILELDGAEMDSQEIPLILNELIRELGTSK